MEDWQKHAETLENASLPEFGGFSDFYDALEKAIALCKKAANGAVIDASETMNDVSENVAEVLKLRTLSEQHIATMVEVADKLAVDPHDTRYETARFSQAALYALDYVKKTHDLLPKLIAEIVRLQYNLKEAEEFASAKENEKLLAYNLETSAKNKFLEKELERHKQKLDNVRVHAQKLQTSALSSSNEHGKLLQDVLNAKLPGDIWTEDEVKSLNEYQQAGYVHPFTSMSGKTLIATPQGWVENDSGPIVQKWAHGFMLNWQWRKMNPFADE